MLHMEQFTYDIRHIRGRENAADCLCRSPVDNAPDVAFKQIGRICTHHCLASRKAKRESEQYPNLQLVRLVITFVD